MVASPATTASETAETVESLQVHESNTDFGQVTANGDLDPTINGLTSTADAGGAFYVRTSTIELTITASGPWSGTCSAQVRADDAGTAPGLGAMEWRLSGTTTWAPFPTSESDVHAGANCFAPGTAGTRHITYDLRLRVEHRQPPGPFSATIVFDVEG